MAYSSPLSARIAALVPEVDPSFRADLSLAVRTLGEASNHVGVVVGMSRLSLRLLRGVFARAGQSAPSQNLYDCIVTAASGDPDKKKPGLHLLPDELASCLHTIRVLSNKADHDAERIVLTLDDAENVLRLFLRVVEWFYCEYEAGPRLATIYDPARLREVPQVADRNIQAPNLPVPPTPLIGRDRELAEVTNLLRREDVWLVSLTGAGGSGKTRLALGVAAGARDVFPTGVFFVDLASVAEQNLVIPRIAHALGVAEASESSVFESVRAHLQNSQVLLVLDNFEHVIAAAPLVAELHASCGGTKFLVTSRASLRLRGEREYPIPPLPVPDLKQALAPERLAHVPAVELFIQRATAAQPGFSMTEGNAPILARICVRLEGLPLAIELAAARIKVLAPSAILERLDDRLKLLTGGARDLPERQQTLRATVGWSYDLLKPPEQWMFRQLSVFAGSFSLEAAEAVCSGADGDLLDGLTTLVDSSLLTQTHLADGEHRYQMLEVLRDYGIERLRQHGQLPEVQNAHATWFLDLAEQARPALSGPEQAAWLARLESEHDNFRAALAFSASKQSEVQLRLAALLLRFWHVHGHLTEARKQLAAALANNPTGADEHRLRALIGAGSLAFEQGDYQQATTWFHAGMQLAEKLGNQAAVATLLNNLGGVAHEAGDLDRAVQMYERSLDASKELDERYQYANALCNLGAVAHYRGQGPEAASRYEEALAIWRGLGDSNGILHVLSNLALLTAQMPGRERQARDLGDEALLLARELGYKQAEALVLTGLGSLAETEGDLTQAALLHTESLNLFRAVGAQSGVARALGNLGLILLRLGDVDQAESLCRESLDLFVELGEEDHVAYALEGMATVVAATGPLIRAAQLIGAAEALRERIGSTRPQDSERRIATILPILREKLSAGDLSAAMADGRTRTLNDLRSESEQVPRESVADVRTSDLRAVASRSRRN